MAIAAPIGVVPMTGPLAEGLRQRRIPSLDGLRAVAVLLVILNHLGVPYAPDGRGVLTFFVLSGFLITWMLLNESDRYDGISIRDFYIRRVLRIFPAFYAFWLLHFGAFLLTRGVPSGSALADYLSSFFYVGNYRRALSHSQHQYIAHTWALSVEEQFYLIWPLVFAFFQKDLRRLTRVLAAAIVLVDLYRIVLYFGFHVRDRWLSYTFDSRIDHLLVGCLLAILLKQGALLRFWNFITSRLWISILTFGLIVASIVLNDHYHLGYKYAVGFVVDPLLTGVFLLQVIAWGHSRAWGWLNWRVTRYLGQISYSMFLYHGVGNHLAVRLLEHKSKLMVAPVAISCTVMVATASYYLIEIKFLRLKSKFIGRRTAVPPTVSATEYGLAST